MDILRDKQIILASSSESRKLVLDRVGISFDVVASGVDESVPKEWKPKQVVEVLAHRKADAVFQMLEEHKTLTGTAVIAADSMVLIDDNIIGKPADIEDARKTLHMLSGRTHEIITGVCIRYGSKIDCFSVTTKVEFYELTENEIDEYLNVGESLGKAGSYGIEGKGALLIRSIDGDYNNIVGIPIAKTIRRLKAILL